MEQVGILIGILVIGTFLYLKFVNEDPGRKLKRAKRKYEKIAAEVNSLRKEAKTGSVKRAINRLRDEITEAREELDETELLLAMGEEKDSMANAVVKLATKNGLMIKAFGELTEKSAIEDISNGETAYPHRYYRITLKGRFQALRQFLGGIDDLPKLIAIRKISIEKVEEEAYMRATVWITI
jgi:Tfp pilus assembly protein PilO